VVKKPCAEDGVDQPITANNASPKDRLTYERRQAAFRKIHMAGKLAQVLGNESGRTLTMLSLPLGTEERRAPGLNDALDTVCAVTVRAGFAFAPVDGKIMLEISQLPIGLDIVL